MAPYKLCSPQRTGAVSLSFLVATVQDNHWLLNARVMAGIAGAIHRHQSEIGGDQFLEGALVGDRVGGNDRIVEEILTDDVNDRAVTASPAVAAPFGFDCNGPSEGKDQP